MKSNSLLVLACLVSTPVFAQSLPDEINYPPHELRYENLNKEVSKAESSLSKSRSDLEETRRFMQQMHSHIGELQNSIERSRVEIGNNQRMIPEVRRQISDSRNTQSQIGSELRRLQDEESRVHQRQQYEYRNLRPLEERVERKQRNVRELRSELARHIRLERDANNRLAKAEKELVELDREFEQESKRHRQLTQELNSMGATINGLQTGISKLESETTVLNSTLATENQKLTAITARVQEYEAELVTLRSQNAPQEKIAELQRKVKAATNTRNNTAIGIAKIQGQIDAKAKQIKANQARIAQLNQEQTALPAKIAQSEARQSKLILERGPKISLVNRFRSELVQVQRNVQVRENTLIAATRDLDREEAALMNQRQVVENLNRQIEAIRREIYALSSRHQSLEQEIAGMDKRVEELEASIPRLHESIRRSENEISEGQREIGEAEKDEVTLLASISRQESELADLIAARNNAQIQMGQRLSLYNRYLKESQDLGSSQTRSAITLGESEGSRLAEKQGSINGSTVGKELGLSEAKYWGYVRGEVLGYAHGYNEGRASETDRSRGEIEGQTRGKQNAHLYAQANFKPVFFEELLLEEFKKPLAPKALTKSFNNKMKSFSEFKVNAVSVFGSVAPLSQSELDSSQQLATELDQAIERHRQDVNVIEAKATRLSEAQNTYSQPDSVPFGNPDCNKVYKGLAVFKKACASSYKDFFKANFLSAARAQYSNEYGPFYERVLAENQIAVRDNQFDREFNSASEITKAHGLRVGKEEIYQQTFAISYSRSYDEELPLAREKAKFDAGVELTQLIDQKPLLTLGEKKLEATDLRGGEEVTLVTKVKNISKVALNGAAIIRITGVKNAEILVGQGVLNQAEAQSLTAMPHLKVRVSPTAKSGDKLIVKGIVELPGDLYKTQRQESFELVETLALNPANETNLNYDNTPGIKSWLFRRNIHFMNVKITSMVEDLAPGYTVSLKAIENADLIDLKEGALETGPVNLGETKDLRFSYVFPDAADNKTVILVLSLSFQGKEIKTEKIELRPH
jgi:peptidoglycan hydrolase CwlO-like protein